MFTPAGAGVHHDDTERSKCLATPYAAPEARPTSPRRVHDPHFQGVPSAMPRSPALSNPSSFSVSPPRPASSRLTLLVALEAAVIVSAAACGSSGAHATGNRGAASSGPSHATATSGAAGAGGQHAAGGGGGGGGGAGAGGSDAAGGRPPHARWV